MTQLNKINDTPEKCLDPQLDSAMMPWSRMGQIETSQQLPPHRSCWIFQQMIWNSKIIWSNSWGWVGGEGGGHQRDQTMVNK